MEFDQPSVANFSKEELLSHLEQLIKDISDHSCRKLASSFFISEYWNEVIPDEMRGMLSKYQEQFLTNLSSCIYSLELFEIHVEQWDGDRETVRLNDNFQYHLRLFMDGIYIKALGESSNTLGDFIMLCLGRIKESRKYQDELSVAD